jgi:hypothetical protein
MWQELKEVKHIPSGDTIYLRIHPKLVFISNHKKYKRKYI